MDDANGVEAPALAPLVDRQSGLRLECGLAEPHDVELDFPGQVVWIKFIGTHGSYDRIDVKKL